MERITRTGSSGSTQPGRWSKASPGLRSIIALSGPRTSSPATSRSAPRSRRSIAGRARLSFSTSCSTRPRSPPISCLTASRRISAEGAVHDAASRSGPICGHRGHCPARGAGVGFCSGIRHATRGLAPCHPDHERTRAAIARMLGRLPLALELAGAYLGKYSNDVSLEEYRQGLESDGALATLDADATELTEADLRRVHDPAVAATIGEQWASLRTSRLGCCSGSRACLGIDRGANRAARPSGGNWRRGEAGTGVHRSGAVQLLDDACLAERLEGDHVGCILDSVSSPLNRRLPTRLTNSAASASIARQRHLSTFRRSRRVCTERGCGCPPGRPDHRVRAVSSLGFPARCSNFRRAPPAPAQGSRSAW